MGKTLKVLIVILIYSFLSFINCNPTYAADIAVSGKAKFVNTNGYLDFSNYSSNVVINNSNGNFTGHAFSQDLGWLDFGSQENLQGPVMVNLSTGVVSGKAYVINTGEYVEFTNNNSNVTIGLTSGVFSGYAWSNDLGWIDFSDTGVETASSLTSILNSINYNVQQESCNESEQILAPDLFQINVSYNSAKLFFTPLSNTNIYYISYSTKPNAEEHGVILSLSKEGVQSYTVNRLKPNTTYYFKVRGHKTCKPGKWSNILKVTTKKNSFSFYSHVYKNKKVVPLATSAAVLNINNNNQTQDLPTKNSVPTNNSQTQKKCFLFWCW